ncbi:helix-turn-helix domain-containing protein [Shewanella waksmanii]|uniref:helix-turn-helix domain-containing protein n=1 Tax=Shewanella waksmanii TaxID=213783 RepID=UPI0037370CC3
MDKSRYTGIDEYLFQKRVERELSQEGLVQVLQQYSPLFNEIDVLTISRWERGKVSPNIRRQVALMSFFGDEPHLLLTQPDFHLKQLPSLNAFQQMLDKQMTTNHQMGAHPYIPHDEMLFEKTFKQVDNLPQRLRWICHYHRNLTRQREMWSESWLAKIVAHASTEILFYQHDDILLGHAIYIRVTESTMMALLRGEIIESDLDVNDLVAKHDEGWLFLLTSYIGGRFVAEDYLMWLMFTLLENPLNKALGYKARSDFGIKLADFLNSDKVAHGQLLNETVEGAKYLGKRYSYVAFLLDRQAALSTPVMLKMMRDNQR